MHLCPMPCNCVPGPPTVSQACKELTKAPGGQICHNQPAIEFSGNPVPQERQRRTPIVMPASSAIWSLSSPHNSVHPGTLACPPFGSGTLPGVGCRRCKEACCGGSVVGLPEAGPSPAPVCPRRSPWHRPPWWRTSSAKRSWLRKLGRTREARTSGHDAQRGAAARAPGLPGALGPA